MGGGLHCLSLFDSEGVHVPSCVKDRGMRTGRASFALALEEGGDWLVVIAG